MTLAWSARCKAVRSLGCDMWLFLSVVAAAHLEIQDGDDARYLVETFRGEEAVGWLQGRMMAEPEDPAWVILWLSAVAQDFGHARKVIPGLVDEWAAEHPSLRAQTARAMARVLAAHGDNVSMSRLYAPDEAGPWCDDALAVLADLPEGEVRERYEAVWWRWEIGSSCQRDVSMDELEMKALEGSDEAPPPMQLRAMGRGLAESDLPKVDVCLKDEPWAAGVIAGLLRDERADPAEAAVRERLIAWTTSMTSSQRAWEVYLGVKVLDRLGEDTRAARLHLQQLDPDNYQNRWALSPPETDLPAEVTAAEQIDPVERLRALRRTRGPAEPWERDEERWARVEALRALGEDTRALAAMDRWWRQAPGYGSNVAFAEAALEAGRRLGHARVALDVAVDVALDPGDWPTGLDAEEERDGWLSHTVQALDARARLYQRRGRLSRAVDDWELALALQPDLPEQRVQLGLAYRAWGWREEAREALATGLAGGVEDAGLRAQATDALEDLLRGVWSPGGPEGYVRATAAALGAPSKVTSEEEALVLAPEVMLVVDGVERSLSSFEGPLVLDLWATWCGPCRQSLPHLDALARQWGEAITVLAISVDHQQVTADRYVAAQGDAAFVWAWGGLPLKEAFEVDGIPAYFVLDAEHHIVATGGGFGPGSRVLEDAVERGLGRR